MKTDCSQKQLLNRIDQVSFAVNDMTLYLDTHPCDEKALTYCHELVQERKKLLKEYAEAYGPLIIDITDQTGESIWKWMEQPFPWEKEGACRQNMWNYEKRLQYPINITTPNAKLAQFIMSQYGGLYCNTL